MSEKWWDMSDDELDDLFREASDKVEVPFESSSFDKLRQKIDIQRTPEPPKGYKKRWLVLLAGLFLMVGIGLVYRSVSKKQGLVIDSKGNYSTKIVGKIEHNNKLKLSNVPSSVQSEILKNNDSKLLKSKSITNKETISTLQKENIVEKSRPPLSIKMGKPLSPELPQTIQKTNLDRLSVKTTGTHSQTTTQNSSVKNININNQRETIVGNNSEIDNQLINNIPQKPHENAYYQSTDNQLITKNNSKILKDKKGKNDPSISIINEQNTSSIIESLPINQEKNLSEETVNRTNFYGIDFLKNKDSKSLLTDIHTKLPDYVDSLPRTMKPLKFSKFGLRLVVSPDFNSIENLGKMALGGSIGLLFEYKISKKLVVQTGMVYSKKSYIGSFDDYHNWTEWKTYHPSKPTEVDGGCKVIDVPINLRLNLFQKPNQTWFVSSGISSYWMVNESYTYNYAWSPSKTSDWSDNSKYYFSVLNFSVGLERQISKRFSLQVEPYLKTPLKNVGRGGVNLYSSGVLFSTKYAF